MQCEIRVVGLGVRDGNLALNLDRHCFHVSGFELDPAKARILAMGPAARKTLRRPNPQVALISGLGKPRRLALRHPERGGHGDSHPGHGRVGESMTSDSGMIRGIRAAAGARARRFFQPIPGVHKSRGRFQRASGV
jgi:hypothetical protein